MTTKHTLWQVAGVSALTSAMITGVVLLSLRPLMAVPQTSQRPDSVSVSSEKAVSPLEFDVTPEDSPVVRVVQRAEPAVVSVIISKEVPVIERSFQNVPFGDSYNPFNIQLPQYQQNGTQKREI